ncbi:transmembrane protein 53-like [Oculina patagonica]
MALLSLRTKKCFTLCQMCHKLMSVPHRTTISESTHFQAKCKKIGAVVTRVGTESASTCPIVALLGWNSAQDKHLAKYSEIFEQKGFDTVRIPANPYNTFIRLSKVKEISMELLDILVEIKSQQNQPFILYAFSMGGFNMYYFIKQAITTPEHKHFNTIHVMGCIFDSCPHFPGFHSLKGIQSTILETIPNPLIKVPVWVGLAVVVPPVFYFTPYIKQLIPGTISSPLGCPELFLFCKTDPLVPYKDVQTFIDAHKNKNIKVFSQCWEVSGHVQHYKNYPEEYLRELNTFTDYCLKQHLTSKASKL